MASRSIEDLHPILAEAYIKAVEEYRRAYTNFSMPFLTCTYRSNEEQNALYAQGRTKPGDIVTWATAGKSPHNYKPALAFDIAFQNLDKKTDYNKINFNRFANIILKIDSKIEWGGNWIKKKDLPHFQLKNWRKYIINV